MLHDLVVLPRTARRPVPPRPVHDVHDMHDMHDMHGVPPRAVVTG
ncbi:hypothetical protein [Streptosporangium vulgare]|uniref:Uncharacterized protein n=1 Tax=Streptosporangium vulgare TaxID=46190 RepID=A0ABV5TFE1_9ACTN